MASPHRKRIQQLQQQMPGFGIDTLVVMDRVNTRYLTGFTCSYSLLVIDEGTPLFITDSRYGEVAQLCLGADFDVVVQPKSGVKDFIRDLLRRKVRNFVGYEGSIAVDEFDRLNELLEGRRFQNATKLITGLRSVKTLEEIVEIRKATALADSMMAAAISSLRVGRTELEISREIRFSSELLGGQGESFANIVASGPNSSRPHHQATDRVLAAGDPVTIDLGGRVNGYCSDLTRTVVLGSPDPEFRRIYDVCLAANEAAIAAVRPGMTGIELDLVARTVIENAGYGEFFGHGLGHGVGLEIHEDPRLSPNADKEYKLPAGAIVTIEPGIYLPGRFGVRIEDYVLLTESGCEVLSKAPKGFTVL